ncbi:MAG TPA: NADH:flavin oxidoreductase/NADH oxidase [Negativicutes bacterium]|nr:NADH:flavin oxidoreductase/NADH oxidase [Negativicutes bacterium]
MLFTEFAIKGLTLKNRIVMPPMCMYVAGRDGLATDWHYLHYATRAVGGVGLIIQEATGVEDGGRITARDLGLWDDSQAEGLRRITAAAHLYGAKIAVQLNHAGRKSEVDYLEPVAPSSIPFSDKYRTPRELDKAAIAAVVARFAVAAGRAAAVGYDAVEIHAAHGYLISQFLSPLSNKRGDKYGGAPANRARLLGEVVAAVRGAIPAAMPVIVRVSASDWEEGGNTPESMAEMLNNVKSAGIDLVHVSSGAVTPTAPRAFPGYQIPFALAIREKTGLPVIGGGLVTEPIQAQQVVKSGVDLVFLGRELLRSPYWPLRAAFVLGREVAWPEPYLRGKFL